jgi:hypothetical protein
MSKEHASAFGWVVVALKLLKLGLALTWTECSGLDYRRSAWHLVVENDTLPSGVHTTDNRETHAAYDPSYAALDETNSRKRSAGN